MSIVGHIHLKRVPKTPNVLAPVFINFVLKIDCDMITDEVYFEFMQFYAA
jgi:hypothetical protein